MHQQTPDIGCRIGLWRFFEAPAWQMAYPVWILANFLFNLFVDENNELRTTPRNGWKIQRRRGNVKLNAERMKQTAYLILTLALFSCRPPGTDNEVLQRQIDSLRGQLADAYKPGFGEFMSNIQAHHVKLWFAGKNENWALADFEIHEIMEALDDIEKYQTERKESQLVGMIHPALDSVNVAIENKDAALFKDTYIALTNTCNRCHRAADFGFNIVKIPDAQPFSNQEFKPNTRLPSEGGDQ